MPPDRFADPLVSAVADWEVFDAVQFIERLRREFEDALDRTGELSRPSARQRHVRTAVPRHRVPAV